jgi:hypothetical protein
MHSLIPGSLWVKNSGSQWVTIDNHVIVEPPYPRRDDVSDILPQRAQSRRGAQAKLIGGEGRDGLLDVILVPLPLGVEDLRERHALM